MMIIIEPHTLCIYVGHSSSGVRMLACQFHFACLSDETLRALGYLVTSLVTIYVMGSKITPHRKWKKPVVEPMVSFCESQYVCYVSCYVSCMSYIRQHYYYVNVCLQLFQRCLMKVLSIDLWKTYLQYIKQTKASLPTFR